jgi:transcription elongation factor Elf1
MSDSIHECHVCNSSKVVIVPYYINIGVDRRRYMVVCENCQISGPIGKTEQTAKNKWNKLTKYKTETLPEDKKNTDVKVKEPKLEVYSAYRIEWTEYERGWGQRHDSYSYHASKEIADNHLDALQCQGSPDCYVRGEDPKLVEVDKDLWNEIQEKETVVR